MKPRPDGFNGGSSEQTFRVKLKPILWRLSKKLNKREHFQTHYMIPAFTKSLKSIHARKFAAEIQ